MLPSNYEDGDTWVKVIETPAPISLVAAGTFAEANNPATMAPGLPAGVAEGIDDRRRLHDPGSASFAFPEGWTSSSTRQVRAERWRLPGGPIVRGHRADDHLTGHSAGDTVIAQIAGFSGVDDDDPIDTIGPWLERLGAEHRSDQGSPRR